MRVVTQLVIAGTIERNNIRHIKHRALWFNDRRSEYSI
jgi:hypothetical protein